MRCASMSCHAKTACNDVGTVTRNMGMMRTILILGKHPGASPIIGMKTTPRSILAGGRRAHSTFEATTDKQSAGITDYRVICSFANRSNADRSTISACI